MGLLEEESQVDSGLLEGFEVLGGDGGPQFERLVDGEDAGEGKHPWHVGLVREESKTGVLGWIRWQITFTFTWVDQVPNHFHSFLPGKDMAG